MRFNTLFVLLIAACVCLAVAQVSYDDCCLKYVKNMNPRTQRHVVAYRRQVTDGGCNIQAIIFTMRRGRVLCADPREKWVVELMEKVDGKKPKTGGRKGHRKLNQQQPYRG